jgi:hypothetical protein
VSECQCAEMAEALRRMTAERDALREQVATLQADARLGAMVRNGVRTQHRLNLKYDPWQEAYHVTVDLAELNVRGDHLFRHRVNADLDAALAAALEEETP